jgi:hypothetical protein
MILAAAIARVIQNRRDLVADAHRREAREASIARISGHLATAEAIQKHMQGAG